MGPALPVAITEGRLDLEAVLGTAPVTALGVVPDRVASLQADPVRHRPVGLHVATEFDLDLA